MIISIVVPTYNRNAHLAATLESILLSDSAGFKEIEVIVVDDGSPVPVGPILETLRVGSAFSLRAIRQENAGPAAARNTGFRASRGDIVLFVDDDIICPPVLVRRHVEAHRSRPGSVIYGPYPYVRPQPVTRFSKYVETLGYLDEATSSEKDFLETAFIASGHISVERRLFDCEQGVYRDDLYTPVAEEYELAWRLKNRGIPTLLATRINALHNRPVELGAMSRQAYTHGRGCAEVAVRCPGALQIPELKRIVEINGPVRWGDPLGLVLKKTMRRFLSPRSLRKILLCIVTTLERYIGQDRVLDPFYRSVLGQHFFAGIRDGIGHFSRQTTVVSQSSQRSASGESIRSMRPTPSSP